MNLRDALFTATARLRELPELREEASEDATLLLLHVLGISRATLLTSYRNELSSQQQSQFNAALARRLRHEPVQYITGEREFYGLPLRVTPAVLIPRNLTEHLVEAVLAELQPPSHPWRIADIGTGSGAIAIALAAHLPHAQLTALDLSDEALKIAAENVTRNSLHDRIRLLRSDLLNEVIDEPPFDAIVSNPPYVPLADRATLAPQVRDYEPPSALFASGDNDDDGLEVYRRLIPQAFAALKPGGLIALEFGPGQHLAIASLLKEWHSVRLIEDFDRTPRLVLARKP